MSVSVLVNGSPTVVADQIPVGTIANISNALSIYTGSAWLLCDGSAVSRTTYAQLFAAIGITFGSGDGATTFNLPTRAKLNNRVLLNLTTGQTFAAFTEDTDIVMNNSVAAAFDISAGAVVAGIRISIIEKSTVGVTIYTDPAHTQSCLMPQGMFLLEWDGVQWHLVEETARVRIQFTSSGSLKTPFAGFYTLIPVGGGGGGGGTGSSIGSAGGGSGGGGGGGGASSHKIFKLAGSTLTITIGGGGGASTSGGNTTISDGSITVIGPGGGAGGSGGSATATSNAPIPGNGGGGGGGGNMISAQIGQMVFAGSGGSSGQTGGGAGGAGGAGIWTLGNSGGHGNNGAGAAGCAFIEF